MKICLQEILNVSGSLHWYITFFCVPSVATQKVFLCKFPNVKFLMFLTRFARTLPFFAFLLYLSPTVFYLRYRILVNYLPSTEFSYSLLRVNTCVYTIGANRGSWGLNPNFLKATPLEVGYLRLWSTPVSRGTVYYIKWTYFFISIGRNFWKFYLLLCWSLLQYSSCLRTDLEETSVSLDVGSLNAMGALFSLFSGSFWAAVAQSEKSSAVIGSWLSESS